MSKKKILTFFIVTIVVGTLIFIIIDKTVDKKLKEKNSNSNSNVTSTSNSNSVVSNEQKKEIEIIDFDKYNELKSNIHDDEMYAILIMKSEDEVCNTFKEEVLKSFNNRKSKVYEIDIDKLEQVNLSILISDISKIQKYDNPTLVTPTLLVSKKGEIVYVREGLMYSSELIKKLDENGIE